VIELKFGNSKLPRTTMIFNMSSAEHCPAKGFCLVRKDCYARPPEKAYPACQPYRERQKEYWLNTPAKDIIKDIDSILSRKRKLPTLFRFNEAGDFHSQECVHKLSAIATFLLKKYNIITYGYSARKDLSFKNARFLVKSSGYNNGNNGVTRVFEKGATIPNNFFLCPGSCKTCSACTTGVNIAFIKH